MDKFLDLQYPPTKQKSLLPISHIQIVFCYSQGSRRMDKIYLTSRSLCNDAGVGHLSLVSACRKKHQIPFFQFAFRDLLAHFALLLRSPRHLHAHASIGMEDQR